MILLVELPIGWGIAAVVSSIHRAYQHNFRGLDWNTLVNYDLAPILFITLFVIVTTPYRWLLLYRFFKEDRAAQSFFRYLASIIVVFLLCLLHSLSYSVFPSSGPHASDFSSFAFALLPMLVLLSMAYDAKRRCSLENDTALTASTPHCMNSFALVSIKILKDESFHLSRKIPSATDQQVKSLGFQVLGICEEKSIPLAALIIPMTALMIFLKENMTIDSAMRIVTRYPLLKSVDGTAIASVLSIGVGFYTFFDDGWALVSTNRLEASRVSHSTKFDTIHYTLNVSEMWVEHQKRVSQAVAQGRTISKNLEERFAEQVSKSITPFHFLMLSLSSWVPILVALNIALSLSSM